MKLYPAIDLKGGRCVRLFKGDFNLETQYGDPVEIARRLSSLGAKYLHVVDLDGATCGESKNLEIVKAIIENTKLEVELGGGIRSISDISSILALGVSRVILGSIAVKNKDIVREAVKLFGTSKIVIGIDSDNFKVKVGGWLEQTSIDTLEFAKEMEELGIKTIIFTDISKDGTLSGPNFDQTKMLIENTRLEIIASGGVKDILDLEKAKAIGCSGIIIGKAFYEGSIDMAKALEIYR